MYDAHVSFSGYRESPRGGGVFNPFVVAERLLGEHATGWRRLGVAGEFAQYLEAEDVRRSGSRSGAWIDGALVGSRLTRVCRTPEAVAQAIGIAEREGFEWAAFGGGLPLDLLFEGLRRCTAAGLRAAVEARPDLSDVPLDMVGSIEGVLGLVTDDVRRPVWIQVARLAAHSASDLAARVDGAVEAGVPVIPLLTAIRRRCLLEEAVSAAGGQALVDILPYHARLLEMRNGAALRFGRRYAEEHLGLDRLDKGQRKAFEEGWSRLGEVLQLFERAGGKLTGGTGAPDLGLTPGYSLHEEQQSWRGLGLSDESIDRAFLERARALCETVQ
jgi:hypothetical protein